MTIRIMLVDDHQIFREALQRLLITVPDLKIVGLASSGSEVVELAQATAPQVICMDINMPGVNGIEVTRSLSVALPEIKVVLLSAYLAKYRVLEAMQAGAKGYVTKCEGHFELLSAIRETAQGRTYLSPEVTALMVGDLVNSSTMHYQKSAISKREWQVLKLVVNGDTSIVIAQKLGITASTAEAHRRNIRRKLGLHSVAELIRYVGSNVLSSNCGCRTET